MTKDESNAWLKQSLIERVLIAEETREALSKLEGNSEEIFADAVEIATKRLAPMKAINSDTPGFDTYAAIAYFNHYLPNGMVGEDISELMVLAETDWFAYRVLLLVNALTPSEMQVDNLRTWSKREFLGLNKTPKKPRGTSSVVNIHRDVLVTKLIGQLEEIGFSPMRGRESPPFSGCDVVQKALENIGIHIGYTSVEKIWQKRNERCDIGLGNDFNIDLARKILSEE